MSENKQLEEKGPSHHQIHSMMAELIKQHDIMIKLLEKIAHSCGSKEAVETSNNEDAPPDEQLTGMLCYYIISYFYFLFMIYIHLF